MWIGFDPVSDDLGDENAEQQAGCVNGKDDDHGLVSFLKSWSADCLPLIPGYEKTHF
jgi:hypothetical protein